MCGQEEPLPFKCKYCKGYFCLSHRLPENHNCPNLWLARAPRVEEERVAPPEAQRAPIILKREHFRPVHGQKIIWFSLSEVKELIFATVLILLVGFSIRVAFPFFTGIDLMRILTLGFIFTLSFLSHEIAHKFTAQSYGYWAEFRLFPLGVLLTSISIFFPIKFIAPGAVLIAGPVIGERYGKTALAGPTMNIVLGGIFYALYLVGANPVGSQWGALFNAYIALFNLIPLGILDGGKVFEWNKGAWVVSFGLALLMFLTMG